MNTVIYHNADYDGIFCREIARKFLPEEDTQFIGWNFGDPKVSKPAEGQIYIMDLSPDCLEGIDCDRNCGEFHDAECPGLSGPCPVTVSERIIWIDHHKTSIEKFPTDIPGCRIDGVAACRLAWQWFAIGEPFPPKAWFVERKVSEPLAVRLAGEYDVWDHRGDGDLELQCGIRATLECAGADFWPLLLSDHGTSYVSELIERGKWAMNYSRTVDAGNMKASFLTKWEGLTFLCLNGRGNSLTFASLDEPETGHDALLMFYLNQHRMWVVSLYHARHRTDLDLSQIATKHGGGGHRGACGFTCDKLPFIS